jgi:hypothetical protein
MICTLTARRLKPGSYDDFMDVWHQRPDDHRAAEAVAKWNPVYATRDVNDENVVVSFGFFHGSLEELRAAQEASSYAEAARSWDQYVEEVLLDGAYEVVEADEGE